MSRAFGRCDEIKIIFCSTQQAELLAASCSGVGNFYLLSAGAFGEVDLPQCRRSFGAPGIPARAGSCTYIIDILELLCDVD